MAGDPERPGRRVTAFRAELVLGWPAAELPRPDRPPQAPLPIAEQLFVGRPPIVVLKHRSEPAMFFGGSDDGQIEKPGVSQFSS